MRTALLSCCTWTVLSGDEERCQMGCLKFEGGSLPHEEGRAVGRAVLLYSRQCHTDCLYGWDKFLTMKLLEDKKDKLVVMCLVEKDFHWLLGWTIEAAVCKEAPPYHSMHNSMTSPTKEANPSWWNWPHQAVNPSWGCRPRAITQPGGATFV